MKKTLPWFHCYPEKWLGALQAMPPDQGYVYFVICLRIYEKRGPIPDDAAALGRRTGYRESHIKKIVDRLCELGKLKQTEAGLMNPFAEHEIASGEAKVSQTAKKRSDAAKVRWQKPKEKQKPKDANGDADALHRDTDLDLDIEKKEPTLFESGTPARASKPRRSRLPDDWCLSIVDLAYASEQGFDRSRAMQMGEAFRDHHRNKGTLGLDWTAAWRTWCRNELKFNQQRGLRNGQASGNSGRRQSAAELAVKFQLGLEAKAADHR